LTFSGVSNIFILFSQIDNFGEHTENPFATIHIAWNFRKIAPRGG
jgi:hypothetical protein